VNSAGPSVPVKDPDDFELIDFVQLRNWATFILHALRRHKLLALVAGLATIGITLALLAVMPRTYRVETELLAQRNSLMPALGNPGRNVPSDADVPTRAASETVKRRDNVLSLMKQTDLMSYWERTRPPLLRFKDRVMEVIGPRSEDERVNDMLGFLDQRLTVTTGDSTVKISIDWPDAQLAYRLVDAAQQNFLEQRHSAEVETIAETITILEGHASTLREAIDAAMEDLKHAQDPRSPRPRADVTPLPLPRRDPAQEALKAEAVEVKLMLEAKRRAIKDLEDFRNHRLAELQAELAQQQTVYADAHPAVMRLKQSINALQEESPQLTALRNSERELMVQQEKLSGARAEALPGASRAEVDERKRPGVPGEDLSKDYARTRLRFAMEKYDALLERIDSARIELDTARAAFKYRYSVIRPPTFPRRALKPRVPLVIGGGIFVALLMAVLAVVGADLRSGLVLETWQLERSLGLTVLGQVPRA
jgi:uncharacterized protein involved in exopolysaccharide biosynthesis